MLGLPSLAPIGTRLEKDEIYDVAFSPTSVRPSPSPSPSPSLSSPHDDAHRLTPLQVIVATTANLQIYALPPDDDNDEFEKETGASKGKGKGTDKGTPAAPLKHLRTVARPKLPGGEPQSAFRAARYALPPLFFPLPLAGTPAKRARGTARFNPQDARAFYTVVNTAPARGKGARGAKAAPRRAYVVKWDAGAWAVDKVKKVGDKGVTSFDVRCVRAALFLVCVLMAGGLDGWGGRCSANGRWLAYGSSDFTIGLLDAQTLTVSRAPRCLSLTR